MDQTGGEKQVASATGKVSQPREPTTSSFTGYHPFKHSNARLECLRTRLRKRALRKSSTGWVAIVEGAGG